MFSNIVQPLITNCILIRFWTNTKEPNTRLKVSLHNTHIYNTHFSGKQTQIKVAGIETRLRSGCSNEPSFLGVMLKRSVMVMDLLEIYTKT